MELLEIIFAFVLTAIVIHLVLSGMERRFENRELCDHEFIGDASMQYGYCTKCGECSV